MRRLLLASLLAVSSSTPRPAGPVLDFAGPAGSTEPFLTATTRGGLLASWFEPREGGRRALMVAERSRTGWTPPVTVAERENFFVNWADFPSVVETADGRWVVHWLEKTAARSYAYHIRLSMSADRGRTWSAPATPHTDRSLTEHGFVAMIPDTSGRVDLVWLDGRGTADSATRGAMALVSGALDTEGRVLPDQIVDSRTCDCCQTAVARTSEGLIAVYRDRSVEEVRDISAVRQLRGRWTAPTPVAEDRWVYRACPVNGPAVVATDRRVAVAWYTEAGGTPRVKLARSTDAGASFGTPTVLDDGHPIGRVGLETLRDGSLALVWLEATGDQAEWRVKRLDPGGRVLARWTIGTVPRTRQAGFARGVLSEGNLYVSWTLPGTQGGIRISRLPLSGN